MQNLTNLVQIGGMGDDGSVVGATLISVQLSDGDDLTQFSGQVSLRLGVGQGCISDMTSYVEGIGDTPQIGAAIWPIQTNGATTVSPIPLQNDYLPVYGGYVRASQVAGIDHDGTMYGLALFGQHFPNYAAYGYDGATWANSYAQPVELGTNAGTSTPSLYWKTIQNHHTFASTYHYPPDTNDYIYYLDGNGVPASITPSGTSQPLNDSGVIVGFGFNSTNNNEYAAIYTNSTVVNVDAATTNGVFNSEGYGINNDGDIVGTKDYYGSVIWKQVLVNGTNTAPLPTYKSTKIVLPTGWSYFGWWFGYEGVLNPQGLWNSFQIVNDGGAIIGGAYYTGTDTNIPPGMHGVLLVPDKIQRDGCDVNSTNNTVWVGQQINLTNIISGIPTSAVTSYQWTIPGANNTTNDTAFYDYQPNATNSCYTNLFTPTNYTTNNYINFYWSSGGSNQVVTCREVIYGQTNTVSATFNVSRPSATIFATNGVVAVDNSFRTNGMPYLHFGNFRLGGTPGIKFYETNAPLPSGFISTNLWNQIIVNDAITRTTSSSSTTTNSFGYDGAHDWEYPYDTNTPTSDSPNNRLEPSQVVVSRNFTATMYLMWQASTNSVNGDKTVTVPLKSYTWIWSGTATNGAPAAGWGLQSSTNYPGNNGSNVDVTNEPTWSTNSAYNKFSVP